MTTPATAVDAFAAAGTMLEALRKGETSSVELLEMHLERIQRINPEINAIVTPNYAAARQRAARADQERAGGNAEGALHGLPLTMKDSTFVAGLKATAGIPEQAEHVPAEDGPLASRVFAAGGVLMGKTNIPAFLADWQANSTIFGRTVNPWDHSRTPGGSTGGGSAALAAGLTPLEFGSDIGGSIRVPAAFCGLYGHRPSDSAVPRSAGFPPDSPPNPAAVMAVQGPLARSARDLEIALDVIAGPEPGEDQWRLEIPPARSGTLAGLRVAVLPRIDFVQVDDEIVAAQSLVADVAARAGAVVREAAPPGWDPRAHYASYRAMLNVSVLQQMSTEDRALMVEELRRSGDEFAEGSIRGVTATAAVFFQLMREREYCRRSFRAFFRDYDVLLCPIIITPAFEHDDRPFTERSVLINGKPERYERQLVYPAVATFPGQPATAFPVGLHSTGLPIGLQALGPYLEDRTPIRFAELLEREIGGFTPPPKYA